MNMETMRIQYGMSIEQINARFNSQKFKELRENLDNLGASIQSFSDLSIGTDIKGTFSSIYQIFDQFERIVLGVDIPRLNYTVEFRNVFENIIQIGIKEQLKPIDDSMSSIIRSLGNFRLLHFPSSNLDEKNLTNEEINSKIIGEIFNPDIKNDKAKSTIITLSPVNDKVLKYLAENPEAFYQLEDRDFEIVMAEIYNKLGYEVELTKATRDGGKDIIIRKPEILGDFIYYVECKKNSPKRHIGVGIIRNLVGTINTDRVNGGILATTSYFTNNAKRFIAENKYGYQIQMHDYDMIRKLLDKVV